MKNYVKNFIIILALLSIVSCYEKNKKHGIQELKNGDIIFQTSLSEQSKAIQLATKSPYSHCGIIFKEGSDFFVFEAIQPVQKTPLNKWIKRGKDGHYVVKRLKDNRILTSDIMKIMMEEGKKMNGKNYDQYFEWNNDRIYCSELIWKIYKQAGIELSKPEKLRNFDLRHPKVEQKLKERYGNNVPLDEKVVSPVALFNSKLLERVILD